MSIQLPIVPFPHAIWSVCVLTSAAIIEMQMNVVVVFEKEKTYYLYLWLLK